MAHGTSPDAPAEPDPVAATRDAGEAGGTEGEGEAGGGAAPRAAATETARPGNGAGSTPHPRRFTDDHPGTDGHRGDTVLPETVVASGLELRELPARPLPRQGCCASLRDGLRPPLTPEPLPDLGSVLRAGQEPAPA